MKVILNEPRVAYEPYDSMLTGIWGGRMRWTPKMSGLIRCTWELNNRSPALSGLRDPQVAVLPFGIDRLVTRSWRELLVTRPFRFGQPGSTGPQMNQGFLWITVLMELETGRTIIRAINSSSFHILIPHRFSLLILNLNGPYHQITIREWEEIHRIESLHRGRFACFQWVSYKIIQDEFLKGTYAQLHNTTVRRIREEKVNVNSKRPTQICLRYNLTFNKSKRTVSCRETRLLSLKIPNEMIRPDSFRLQTLYNLPIYRPRLLATYSATVCLPFKYNLPTCFPSLLVACE